MAGVFHGLHHANAGSVPAKKDTRREIKARKDKWLQLASKHCPGVSLSAVAIAFAALPTIVDKVALLAEWLSGF